MSRYSPVRVIAFVGATALLAVPQSARVFAEEGVSVVGPMTIDQLVVNDMMENARNIASARQKYMIEKAKLHAQIAEARQAYFKVYEANLIEEATMDEVDKARRPFAEMLFVKDMLYLSQMLIEGPESKLMDGVDLLSGGKVDNGIFESVRPEFDAWVTAVRKHLGAEPGQFLVVNDEEKFAAAIAASKDEYTKYMKLRNQAELAMRGFADMPGEGERGKAERAAARAAERAVLQRIASASGRIAERHLARERAAQAERAGTAKQGLAALLEKRFGGAAQGAAAREGLDAGFTAEKVDAAWLVIDRLPKTADGALSNPKTAFLPADATDPYDALISKLLSGHESATTMQWLIEAAPGRSVPEACREWEKLAALCRSRDLDLAKLAYPIYQSMTETRSKVVKYPNGLGGWSNEPVPLLKERITYGSGAQFIKAIHAKKWPSEPNAWTELLKEKDEKWLAQAAGIVRKQMLAGKQAYTDVPDDIVQRLRAALPD